MRGAIRFALGRLECAKGGSTPFHLAGFGKQADSPEEFDMAVDVLQGVVGSLADSDAAVGSPKEVSVLIS